MLRKLFAFSVIILYLLVLAVALDKGPLISLQSAVLGLVGLVVLVLTISSVARSISLVDEADGIRKNHEGKIPLVGGLVIFISMIYGAYVFGVDSFYTYVIASLLPIILIGTLDGLKNINIPWSTRLVGQIIASWIVILATDIHVRDLGDLFGLGVIELKGFGIPFTIIAVVGVCNAFNMLDGKDGLAASVSVIVISFLLILLYIEGSIFTMGLVLILSLFVFLLFNLGLLGKERKIFLGDHGSNALGHIIAWILIYLSQEENIITPISAVWFIFIPVTDALLTISKRYLSSRSIFLADNEHFHHILSKVGFSDRNVLIIIILISIISASLAIISVYFNLKEYNFFYGYITLLIIMLLLTGSRKKHS